MNAEVSILKGLIENSPIAVALILLVILFLRHLKDQREAEDKRNAAFTAAIKNQADTFSKALDRHGEADRKTAEDLASRYEARTDRMISIVEQNTLVVGEVRGVLLSQGLISNRTTEGKAQ